VIIDICEPFRFEDKNEFVTKIKIIDHTFNFKGYINNKTIKFHKFVTVHIYSPTIAEAPKAKNVGDIIRLRRFQFVLSERGELIAYESDFSNWLIYKGLNGDSLNASNYKAKWEEKNNNREILPYETKRIVALREWSRGFFASHMIKYITWWSPLIEPADMVEAIKDRTATTDVDIILKVREVKKTENSIVFTDHGKQQYLLSLKGTPVLQVGQVIKLRCINVIYTKEIRIIQLTQKSSCLIVPAHFYDSLAFEKKGLSPNQVKTPEKFSKTPEKGRSKTPDRKTVTPKSKSPAPEKASNAKAVAAPTASSDITVLGKAIGSKKASTVKDLLAVLANPKAHEGKKFIVNGYIVASSGDSVSSIVKKQVEGGKCIDFDAKAPKNTPVTNYIYHFNLSLKDSSVEASNEVLQAYVLTNGGEQHLFDSWALLPAQDNVAAWAALTEAKTSKFNKKFTALRTGANQGSFGLELLITATGKPFFKLFDTRFA
jgi:hypothetical protein